MPDLPNNTVTMSSPFQESPTQQNSEKNLQLQDSNDLVSEIQNFMNKYNISREAVQALAEILHKVAASHNDGTGFILPEKTSAQGIQSQEKNVQDSLEQQQSNDEKSSKTAETNPTISNPATSEVSSADNNNQTSSTPDQPHPDYALQWPRQQVTPQTPIQTPPISQPPAFANPAMPQPQSNAHIENPMPVQTVSPDVQSTSIFHSAAPEVAAPVSNTTQIPPMDNPSIPASSATESPAQPKQNFLKNILGLSTDQHSSPGQSSTVPIPTPAGGGTTLS